MAQFVPTVAEVIAFGIGTRAESNTDTLLQFELGRATIDLVSYDFVSDALIYKATIPDEFEGKINEIALFSQAQNTIAGTFTSRIITTFDSATEEWVDSSTGVDETTFDTSVARTGADGLLQTPSASTTKSSALRGVILDFSGNSNADLFNFAYNVGNSNTSNVKFRFLTDSGNYYEFAMGSQTSGYKIVTAAKSTAVATGTPSWSNITEVQALTTSSSGGASSVVFDGIRIEDVDTINTDYVMVARKLTSPTFVLQEGKTQDIEFALDVTIT